MFFSVTCVRVDKKTEIYSQTLEIHPGEFKNGFKSLLTRKKRGSD